MADPRASVRWALLCGGLALGVAGCSEGLQLPFGQTTNGSDAAVAAQPGETIERDVEAPEVFATTESALWDGRPSLGGVWVAHPDVGDPERVLIRNVGSGESVVGALFRRERNNPGPRIQVSSDAASALGLLAGRPTELSVVALRREEVPVAPPPEPEPEAATEVAELQDGAAAPEMAEDAIESETLDPIAVAESALAEAQAVVAAAAAAPAPRASGLTLPYIQIGIFSVEENADNTAASLRSIGIVPTVLRQESSGNVFWRVIVGPATSSSERAAVLAQIKDLGFEDAYFTDG